MLSYNFLIYYLCVVISVLFVVVQENEFDVLAMGGGKCPVSLLRASFLSALHEAYFFALLLRTQFGVGELSPPLAPRYTATSS